MRQLLSALLTASLAATLVACAGPRQNAVTAPYTNSSPATTQFGGGGGGM